jgi:pimeloyl-ACP methyl ester carboxylesterase
MADVGWDAVAVDARGHGESDWAPDGDYGVDAFAGDLLAVVAQLGGRPVLLGASLGGMTSLTVEGEHSGTARALVLVDVVPGSSAPVSSGSCPS